MAEEEIFLATGTYWGPEGNGRYQDDYDYLAGLASRYGRAETLAGEIMRAVILMNQDFYANGKINQIPVNLLALVGVFNENESTLATLYPYAKGSKHYDGNYHDELQMAVERTNDLVIEFHLRYPDLEYTENSIDMERLPIRFMDKVLADKAQKTVTPPPCNGVTMQVQEVSTPRIANTTPDLI